MTQVAVRATARAISQRRRALEWACAVAVSVVALVGCGRDDRKTSSAKPSESTLASQSQAVTSPPSIGQFAVYATHAVEFNSGSYVSGCDVGVQLATGPFLDSSYAAYSNSGGKIDPTRTLYADSIYLNNGANFGALDTNHLNAVHGSHYGTVSAFPSSMPSPPALVPATAGTSDITVNSGTQTLAAGAFNSINVNSSATLSLSGGTYVFASLTLNSGASLLVTAPTVLSITGSSVNIGSGSYIGPSAGSGLTAKALQLYLDSSAGVSLNSGSKIHALLVATNELVTVDTQHFFGAIAASQVRLNSGANVTCQDGFGALSCSGSCDDGNPCTADACSAGACTHTPVANGTSCNDGNACTQTDSCQSGTCTGSNPIVCTASDQCHAVGTCNPANGTCSNPTVTDGTTCNDGNGCTQTDSCKAGVCTGSNPVTCKASDQCHVAGTCDPSTGACSNPTVADGTTCSDGNLCMLHEACKAGVCTGTPVTCAASDQCHVAGTCNPSTGACTNPTAADGTSCSDGNLCMLNEVCKAGSCTGTPVTCTASDQCHLAGTCSPSTGKCSNPAATDGTKCSDGNLCMLNEACKAGTCTGTPVTCSASDSCHVAGTCSPSTGKCSNPTAPDGTACNDGNLCMLGEACKAGTCTGTPVTCAASDQCHVAGTCSPSTGKCSNPTAADGTTCNDGNRCNTSESCHAGACTGTPVACAASDQCHLAGTCDSSTGTCSNPPVANGTACNDGNPNTVNDVCTGGVCAGVDHCIGVTCTASDQCHVAGTCDHATGLCSNPIATDGTTCNDGNLCNLNESCKAGVCTGTPVSCTASDQCHVAGTCNPSTGKCSNPTAVDGTTCNDGNLCSLNESCKAGVCTGTPVSCTASDQCHVAGTCEPSTGKCSNPTAADGTTCNDGNLCTLGETCKAGVCTGTPVSCTASDQCHVAGTCNPSTGKCSNPTAADGTTCNDGNLCSLNESCKAGVCTGTPVSCTASDQCHVAGTCNPSTGKCSNPTAADGTTCNDGNLCSLNESCKAGVCTGTPVSCTASDQCHVAGSCDPSTGKCSNPTAADGTTCNDGNLCTLGETCKAGACTGTPVVCSASDQCHLAGVCSPSTGKCSNPTVADGTICNDGNACNLSDSCKAGVCVGSNPVVCTATDQCHVAGTCDPKSGTCSNPAAGDGTTCNDGNACTLVDSCKAGACVGTSPVVCTASDQCHVAGVCDPKSGTCSNPAASDGTSCNDGNACNQTDTCKSGACVGSNPVVCAASDSCHVAGSCNPASGTCSNPPASSGTSCPAVDACHAAGTCDGSGTCGTGTPLSFTSSSPCIVASCDPVKGVLYTPAATGTSCPAIDACHAAGACDGTGKCAAGTPISVSSGNPCMIDTCDPALGPQHTPVAAGTSCPAIDLCHAAGSCSATGVCQAGALLSVDDGNPCTADSCNPSTGPLHTPVAVGTKCPGLDECHSAGACDATGTCGDGTLLPVAPVPCPSACASAIAAGTLSPIICPTACETGASTGAACPNGCTAGVFVVSAMGVACPVACASPAAICPVGCKGTPVPASAGLSCPISCASTPPAASSGWISCPSACQAGATSTPDGLACPVGCSAGVVATALDGTPCPSDCTLGATVSPSGATCPSACRAYEASKLPAFTICPSTCVAGTGMTSTGGPCPTGCTSGIGAISPTGSPCPGTCLSPTPPSSCPTSCKPPSGSSSGPLPASTQYAPPACVAEKCASAAACDDGDPCTLDTCTSAGACAHSPEPSGTTCAPSTLCINFECLAPLAGGGPPPSGALTCRGVPINVSSGNPCIVDSCDPTTGAKHVPASSGTSCPATDLCHAAGACDGAGACVQGPALTFASPGPCLTVICDPIKGTSTVNAAAGASCTYDACHTGSTCDGSGNCSVGTPISYSSGNPCMVDACDPVLGVSHTPTAAGVSCPAVDACHNAGTCNGSGSCSAGTAITLPTSSCATYTCDPSTGIKSTPFASGTTCTYDACHTGSACDGAGTCVAGPAIPISSGNPCIVDACNPVTGPSHTYATAGTSCPAPDACHAASCDGVGTCAATYLSPTLSAITGSSCAGGTCTALGSFLPSQAIPMTFLLTNSGTGTADNILLALTGTTESASLLSIGASSSATVSTLSAFAPSVAAKGATETDAAYVTRISKASTGFAIPYTLSWNDLCSATAPTSPVSGNAYANLVVPVLTPTLTGPASATAGSTVTLTAQVTNYGSSTEATSATGVASLPGSTSSTSGLSFGTVPAYGAASKTISYTLPTLAPRGTGESTDAYLARLAAFGGASEQPSFSVTWSDDGGKNLYGALTATATVVPAVPIVTTSISTLPSSAPGDSVSLPFSLQNVGKADALSTVITLTKASTSSSAITISAPPATATTTPFASVSMTTTAPNVAAKGASETDTAYLTRLAAADGARFPVPFQTTWSDSVGSVYGPIVDQASGKVQLPRFSLSMSATATAKPGDVITYLVTVNSVGTGAGSYKATLVTPDGKSVDPFGGYVSGSTGYVSWTVPSTQPTGSISATAQLTWTDTAAKPNSYGPLSATASTSVTRPPGSCPTVNAGPNQTLTLPSSATLAGSISEDLLPPGGKLSSNWVQLSGPGTVAFSASTSLTSKATFPAAGTYVLRLVGTDTQCEVTSDVTITANDDRTKAASPTKGEQLINVLRDGSAIRLLNTPRLYPFIWVAVSGKGTIVKIDTTTGAILGEYLSSPSGQPANPSRTTVERNGGAWATNRGGAPGSYSTAAEGGNTVVHIGLLENGECVDRNHNGVIDTSHGLWDVRAWSNAGGADTAGGVSTADDECILHYVPVSAYGTRHVSVDRNNDIWVSGSYSTGGGVFNLIDGKTGVIKRTEGPVGYGGYGGLMDGSGVIWSARPLLRWDPANPLTGPSGGYWKGYSHDSYGLCLDPSGNVWNTSALDGVIRKFSPAGDLIGTFPEGGGGHAQGCTADKNGDIWVAHGIFGTWNVGHLKNDGTYIGDVATLAQPSGVAVDANGKIWATDYGAQQVERIDPKAGPIGADGVTPVGKVDFATTDLGGVLYDYSDMTGSTLISVLPGVPIPNSGSFSFIRDSGLPGAAWGKAIWTATVPGDGYLEFFAGSSADGKVFSTPVQLTSSVPFTVPNGQYLQITVKFGRSSRGESPQLTDVTVMTATEALPAAPNAAPSVNAGPNIVATTPDPIRITGTVRDDARPTGNPLSITWSAVSGPGTVSFDAANGEATNVTVSATGVYVLRLTASDGDLTSTSDMTLTVNAANTAPQVSVSGGACSATGVPVSLAGTVTDDGLPTWGTLTHSWSKVSGPGSVAFADATSPSTTATFDTLGTYVLRLTASDGELTSSSDVSVTCPSVASDGGGADGVAGSDGGDGSATDGDSGSSGSFGPLVSAGPNRTITLPNTTLTLNGTATEAGSTLTLSWTQVTGIAAGTVSFAPANAAVTTVTMPAVAGTYVLSLSASDSVLSSSSSVTVTVKPDPSVDLPPVVTVGPAITVNAGELVTLNGTVTDDGLPTWGTLTSVWVEGVGPDDPVFTDPYNPKTTVNFLTPGDYVIWLYASDGLLQTSVPLSVHANAVKPANLPPVVSASGPATAPVPGTVTLTGWVTDDGLPAGGTLTQAWAKISGPGTVTFGTPASPTTTASFSAAGNYVLRLTANDTALTTSVDVKVTAVTVNTPPVVSAGSDITISAPPYSSTMAGAVSDDGLPSGILLSQWSTISGPALAIFADPTNPTSTATFPLPGTYKLQLYATDTALSTTATVNVIAQAPTATTGVAPVVSFASTLDGSRITKPTDVIGSVSDGAWSLDIALGDEDTAALSDWKTIANGTVTSTTAISSAKLANLDATLMLNGAYALRLRSTNSYGTGSASASVVVDKQMKIGVMSLAFDDIQVTANGFPIRVQRTYDSRDKRVGDFGVGWNLALGNVRVEKSVNLGKFWYVTEDTSGFFPNYCIIPQRPAIVTITFPSGKVYRFQAVMNASGTSTNCQEVTPISYVDSSFAPMDGTFGSLASDPTAAGLVSPFSSSVAAGSVTVSDASLTPWNPTHFILTDEDGVKYVINQNGGIESITDLDGNTLSVSPTGIFSSSSEGTTITPGKNITIHRDTTGRISSIVDANGKTLSYAYDASGNLATFTNREGETQTYAYDKQHNLLSLTDARGITPATYGYDGVGRLTGVKDAYSDATTFTHDISGKHEEVQDALGNVTKYDYDDDGNILIKTDALGKITHYSYDTNDNKLSETDPLGHKKTWTYDSVANNMLTETDALGKTTTYTWGLNRKMTSKTDALSRTSQWTYFASGLPETMTDATGAVTNYTHAHVIFTLDTTQDPLGHVTQTHYDDFGHLDYQIDGVGNIVTYGYDSNGNRTSESKTRKKSDSTTETLVTQYVYDGQSRLTSTTYPDGSTSSTTYNKIGKPLTTTDQLGRVTSYTYDSLGRQLTVSYPDGTNEATSYDALGRKATQTDKAGRVTTFGYDAVGRLTKTSYADGTFRSSAYDDAGRMTSSTDELGNVTYFGYDAADRRISVTDASGNTSTMAYDDAGQLTSTTDANGNTVSYSYDADGRQTRITYPDKTHEDTTYDAVGNRTVKTDQAGVATSYIYDANNRLTTVTDALGGITTYAYDELGNKVSQTDANTHTTKYAYDSLSRRTSRTLPLGQVESMSYDRVGNMLTRTDFNGRVTAFTYDAMNRISSRTPDSVFSSEAAVSWTYTATGRRATMVDGTGTTSYTYDKRDRLLEKDTPSGNLLYTRDLVGRVLTTRSDKSDGIAVDYAWDANGRLSAVTDRGPGVGTAGLVTSYSYDKAGRPIGWTQPNGVITSLTYDAENRLTNESVTSGSTTIASYVYTLGPTGNRTGVSEASGRTIAWSYDKLYRLTGETITGAASANGAVIYTYDSVGNRLTRSSSLAGVGATSNTYDANDRISGETFDKNGDQLTRSGGAQGFDSQDRLTSWAPASGVTVKVYYDGDGMRVAEDVGGTLVSYLLDDQNPTGYAQVVEARAGGVATRAWVFGKKAISQRARVSGGTWATSFFEHDGHGSVVALTDASGLVTDTYEYDAFGTVIARTGTTDNALTYSGEWMDAQVGLQYLRARWYQPGAGRFASQDTWLGDRYRPDTLHRYLYVFDGPVARIDPTGHAGGDDNLPALQATVTTAGTLATLAQPAIGRVLQTVSSAGGAVVQEASDLAEAGAVAVEGGIELLSELGGEVAEGATEIVEGAVPKVLEQGPRIYNVYYGLINGARVYIGITKDLAARAYQHGSRFVLRAIPNGANLTWREARAIEQAGIEMMRELNYPIQNQINSISPSRDWYATAVAWGKAWLEANGAAPK